MILLALIQILYVDVSHLWTSSPKVLVEQTNEELVRLERKVGSDEKLEIIDITYNDSFSHAFITYRIDKKEHKD